MASQVPVFAPIFANFWWSFPTLPLSIPELYCQPHVPGCRCVCVCGRFGSVGRCSGARAGVYTVFTKMFFWGAGGGSGMMLEVLGVQGA